MKINRKRNGSRRRRTWTPRTTKIKEAMSGNDGQNDADAVLLLALRQAALPLPDAEDLTLDGLVEDAGAFSNAVRTALGKIDPV